MNLDELVNSIPESEAELKSSLKHWVESWKQDDRTTDELSYSISKCMTTFGSKTQIFQINSIATL